MWELDNFEQAQSNTVLLDTFYQTAVLRVKMNTWSRIDGYQKIVQHCTMETNRVKKSRIDPTLENVQQAKEV